MKNKVKDERLLPDISAYILEDNTIDNLEIGRESLQITNDNSDAKNKGTQVKKINNMSISSIKQSNYLGGTVSQRTNTLIKLNQMIVPSDEHEEELTDDRTIVYKRKRPISHFLSKERDYGIVHCQNITTFFVDNFVFSQLTYPLDKENDFKVNCLFLIREKNTNSYIIDEEFRLRFQTNFKRKTFDKNYHNTQNESAMENMSKKLEEFLYGINLMFSADEYYDIVRKCKKSKILFFIICMLTLLTIVFLCVMGFQFNFFFDEIENYQIWLLLVIIFIIVEFTLLTLFVKTLLKVTIVLDDVKLYEVLKYDIKNYSIVESFFDQWNTDSFLKENMFVSTPVTLDYIQFNFNAKQEIELEHHEFK